VSFRAPHRTQASLNVFAQPISRHSQAAKLDFSLVFRAVNLYNANCGYRKVRSPDARNNERRSPDQENASHRFVHPLRNLGGALAQEAKLVKTMSISTPDGWVFEPAISDGKVVGFLAEQVEGAVPVNAFSVLFFNRELSGEYSMVGWTGTAEGLALSKSIKLLDPNLFQLSFYYHSLGAGDLKDATAAVDGDYVEMSSGLTLDDPLQPWANLMTGEAMEMAIQNGAAGAASLSSAEVAFSANADKSNGQLRLKQFEQMVNTTLKDGTPSASGSGGQDWCWPSCASTTHFQCPCGPWTVVGPNAMGICTYTRTGFDVTIECCIGFSCITTCTTIATVPVTQTIRKAAVGGVCEANP
jgi:hypothetical protein